MHGVGGKLDLVDKDKVRMGQFFVHGMGVRGVGSKLDPVDEDEVHGAVWVTFIANTVYYAPSMCMGRMGRIA